MRDFVFACDKCRFGRAKELLVERGYVRIENGVWHQTEKTASVTLGRMTPAWEPHFAASNTARGAEQIDCTLCGLITRAWFNRGEARDWYFHEHVLDSVGHK